MSFTANTGSLQDPPIPTQHCTARKAVPNCSYVFMRQTTRLLSYASNSSIRSCGKQPYYIDGSIGKWTPPHILCLAGHPQFISVVAFSICVEQHWHMRYEHTVQSAMHSSTNSTQSVSLMGWNVSTSHTSDTTFSFASLTVVIVTNIMIISSLISSSG